LDREGSPHTIYSNPANGAKVPFPRLAEIDNRLAPRICQQLAIDTDPPTAPACHLITPPR